MTLLTNQPAATTDTVERDLLRFLERHTKKAWEPDVDLFACGGVSSLFAMQLVMFLEKNFGIAIGGDELKLDNFRTVTAMTELVHRVRNEKGGE